MTTLSRTLESAETRQRDAQWAEWEAKLVADGARRRRKVRIIWLVLTAAAILAAGVVLL